MHIVTYPTVLTCEVLEQTKNEGYLYNVFSLDTTSDVMVVEEKFMQ